jgi:hypothetical protein
VEFKNTREIAEFLQPIYQSNNWTWGGWDTASHIPTVDELEKRIVDLVEDVGQDNGDVLSTGRLMVIRSEFGREIHLALAIPEDDFV